MKKLQRKSVVILTLILTFVIITLGSTVQAQSASSEKKMSDAELVQKLNNPIADLMIFPIQVNYDGDIGMEDEGWRLTTNIQPVIPIKLTEDLDLITRTIIPVVYQEDVAPEAGSEFGLGDINLSLFLAPPPTKSGLIWGVGSILLFPTATDNILGGKKWGAGPSALALKMMGHWTVGAQINHVWSYAGEDNRQNVSRSLLQPFVAYTWPSTWNIALQSESTYNWETENWSVPINATVGKLVRWGKLPVKWKVGIGYWLDSPESGSEGFRLQFQLNFVLPR